MAGPYAHEVDTRPSSRVGSLHGQWPEVLAMIDIQKKRSAWSWWYLLFVIQFAVALWPPFYNKIEPTLIGIPFFYWFQLLWVIVSAVFTAIVYFATSD
jgi:Protein of unknown function (DUF3311)